MNPKTHRPTPFGKVLFAALLAACNATTGNLPDQGVVDAAVHLDLVGSGCSGTETFRAAQTAMLSSCGGGPRSCHQSSPFAGNLDLTTANAYASLVGVPASIASTKLRVRPQDPGGSFLMQKLTNMQAQNEGLPMPQGEGILWHLPDPTALSVLRCWITVGAPNN